MAQHKLYDVVIVGGGHNALTCAGYLAKAGLNADYRMPVKNLYLCGSGAHPGGGVFGLPGHHAAREIIKDFKTKPLARLFSRKSA